MIDVIILAAGSIKNKLYFSDFIYDSPALIPINVRTVSSYILDFYNQSNTRIHLAINKDDETIVKNELCYYNNIDIIIVNESDSVVDTLKQTINFVKPTGDIIVNVVTTVPTKFPNESSILISMDEDLNSQWSGIIVDKDVCQFIRKKARPYQNCFAFTGVFRCQASSLLSILDNDNVDDDLVSVAEQLYLLDKVSFQSVEWIDCGHELNFYEAKSKLISSRSFNAVKIQPDSGVLNKSSKNVKKFCDEVRYIQLLPSDISIFFPTLYGDVQINGDVASVSMEYYGYSTLAEYMLYWNVSEHVWKNVFKSLGNILKKFKSCEYSIGKRAYTDFYLTKTVSRVDDFKKQLSKKESLSDILFSETIIINGVECRSFSSLLPLIESRLDVLYSEDDFCIMHGDLCFNNILYDVKSSVTRLIDARGSFGDKCIGIYGDIKYDLAKVTHSVIGGYDFIVNNLFSLSYDSTGLTYKINYRDNVDFLFALNRRLISDLGFNENDILFIVGLLFVSMCPLHSDDRKRQITMYAHGIKLLNQSII